MMHIQFGTKFCLMDTASLATILVALASLLALLFPIWASVVLFAALPIWAIWARTVLGNPDAFALVAAKLSSAVADVTDGASVSLAASRACAINAVVVWVALAEPILRLPLPHAGHVAKVPLVIKALRGSFLEFLAAVVAGTLNAFASTVGMALIRTKSTRCIPLPRDFSTTLATSSFMQNKTSCWCSPAACRRRTDTNRRMITLTDWLLLDNSHAPSTS